MPATASRSSQRPGTGAYSWSSVPMLSDWIRSGAAGSGPSLGLSLAEVAPPLGAVSKPELLRLGGDVVDARSGHRAKGREVGLAHGER